MPYLQVSSNLNLSDAEKSNALLTLSQAIAELLGKKEDYVMTSWVNAKMTMGQSEAPTAFIEVRAIRLPEDAPAKLSKELCERLSLIVDIRPDRVFINYHDIAASHWGSDGKTFG